MLHLHEQGTVSLDDFWRCIGYVLQLGGMEEGEADWDEASLLAERIHHAFEDCDDMVDFAAITSGVSILCQSSIEEKVSQRCDTRGCCNHTNFLWMLGAMLKVITLVNAIRQLRIAILTHRRTPHSVPSTISQILVAFILFDTDADGKLTFEEVAMYMASVLRVVYAVSEDFNGEQTIERQR